MKPKLNTNQPAKDLCYTPAYATQALCEFLNESNPLYDLSVWECASGEGHIVHELQDYFRAVFPTDIRHDNVDFTSDFELDDWVTSKIDCIITNPPYSSKAKYGFIDKCVELGKDFALLMPLETIGAKKAQEAFAKVGGVSVLLFDTRVDFLLPEIGYDGNGAQFPTAWFISGFGLERNKMYFTSITEAKKQFKADLKKVA
jgi:hypothetical protein